MEKYNLNVILIEPVLDCQMISRVFKKGKALPSAQQTAGNMCIIVQNRSTEAVCIMLTHSIPTPLFHGNIF